MSRYLYSGPFSAVALAGGREAVLIPGGEVELPAENAWVREMIAQKRLTPVVNAVARPPEEPKPAPRAESKPKPEAPAEKEKK